MKVKELIAELQKYAEHAEVRIRIDFSNEDDVDMREYNFDLFHEDETVCFLDLKS